MVGWLVILFYRTFCFVNFSMNCIKWKSVQIIDITNVNSFAYSSSLDFLASEYSTWPRVTEQTNRQMDYALVDVE
jgi:hypothetical protein